MSLPPIIVSVVISYAGSMIFSSSSVFDHRRRKTAPTARARKSEREMFVRRFFVRRYYICPRIIQSVSAFLRSVQPRLQGKAPCDV